QHLRHFGSADGLVIEQGIIDLEAVGCILERLCQCFTFADAPSGDGRERRRLLNHQSGIEAKLALDETRIFIFGFYTAYVRLSPLVNEGVFRWGMFIAVETNLRIENDVGGAVGGESDAKTRG